MKILYISDGKSSSALKVPETFKKDIYMDSDGHIRQDFIDYLVENNLLTSKESLQNCSFEIIDTDLIAECTYNIACGIWYGSSLNSDTYRVYYMIKQPTDDDHYIGTKVTIRDEDVRYMIINEDIRIPSYSLYGATRVDPAEDMQCFLAAFEYQHDISLWK